MLLTAASSSTKKMPTKTTKIAAPSPMPNATSANGIQATGAIGASSVIAGYVSLWNTRSENARLPRSRAAMNASASPLMMRRRLAQIAVSATKFPPIRWTPICGRRNCAWFSISRMKTRGGGRITVLMRSSAAASSQRPTMVPTDSTHHPARTASDRISLRPRVDLHPLPELGALLDDGVEVLEVHEVLVGILADVIELPHALRAAEHELPLVADVDARRLGLRRGQQARHVRLVVLADHQLRGLFDVALDLVLRVEERADHVLDNLGLLVDDLLLREEHAVRIALAVYVDAVAEEAAARRRLALGRVGLDDRDRVELSGDEGVGELERVRDVLHLDVLVRHAVLLHVVVQHDVERVGLLRADFLALEIREALDARLRDDLQAMDPASRDHGEAWRARVRGDRAGVRQHRHLDLVARELDGGGPGNGEHDLRIRAVLGEELLLACIEQRHVAEPGAVRELHERPGAFCGLHAGEAGGRDPHRDGEADAAAEKLTPGGRSVLGRHRWTSSLRQGHETRRPGAAELPAKGQSGAGQTNLLPRTLPREGSKVRFCGVLPAIARRPAPFVPRRRPRGTSSSPRRRAPVARSRRSGRSSARSSGTRSGSPCSGPRTSRPACAHRARRRRSASGTGSRRVGLRWRGGARWLPASRGSCAGCCAGVPGGALRSPRDCARG